jgi:hypothetical protein
MAASRDSIRPRDLSMPQHDRAASIEADDVKQMVANIDAHGGTGGD